MNNMKKFISKILEKEQRKNRIFKFTQNATNWNQFVLISYRGKKVKYLAKDEKEKTEPTEIYRQN